MEAERKALDVVLAELDTDLTSAFARTVFLGVLRRLPAVPRVPGKEVFFELARKGVFLAVELVLIRDGKVYLTPRADEFFVGWHFPGTYREPQMPMIADCRRCAKEELGPNMRITSARKIGFEEHPKSPRFHDGGILTLCKFEGEPQGGRWFSECPQDLIEVHRVYWPIVSEQMSR